MSEKMNNIVTFIAIILLMILMAFVILKAQGQI